MSVKLKTNVFKAHNNGVTETIGALSMGGGGAVDSVNGKTGAVVLNAADVGARADTWTPRYDVYVTKNPFGEYSSDAKASEIRAAQINGNIPQMWYTAEDGIERKYEYVGVESGAAVFEKTYIDKSTKKAKRVIAKVQENKSVLVEEIYAAYVDNPASAGTDGQFLVSDGAGGTKWLTLPNAEGVEV